MDTNECSSGFPARDLSWCGTGDNREALLARRQLWGSREAAKGNAQVRCSLFGVHWASRGRESAGAAAWLFVSREAAKAGAVPRAF